MDDNTPYISVMILCYNYGHLLKKALDACAAQTFRDFEIVMINNGSTDNTEEVYREFCRENPEIRTTYAQIHPNQGPCHGWNEGLRLAKGEYVLLNDADDWMEPDCLELLAEKAKETGADRVTGQYREVLPDGTVVRVRKIEKKETRLPTMMLQGTIFRRSVIADNNLRFPDTFFLSIDIWFVFNFAVLENNHGTVVRKTIYNYYYNPKSVTQNLTNLEKRYKISALPLVEQNARTMALTGDEQLKNEIEYLTVRNIYSTIIETYQNYGKDIADKYYSNMREKLMSELPRYRKNPLLWNINNGYEKPGNVACMVVGVLDVFKAKGIMRLVAKAGRNSGLIPKNVSAEKDGEKNNK